MATELDKMAAQLASEYPSDGSTPVLPKTKTKMIWTTDRNGKQVLKEVPERSNEDVKPPSDSIDMQAQELNDATADAIKTGNEKRALNKRAAEASAAGAALPLTIAGMNAGTDIGRAANAYTGMVQGGPSVVAGAAKAVAPYVYPAAVAGKSAYDLSRPNMAKAVAAEFRKNQEEKITDPTKMDVDVLKNDKGEPILDAQGKIQYVYVPATRKHTFLYAPDSAETTQGVITNNALGGTAIPDLVSTLGGALRGGVKGVGNFVGGIAKPVAGALDTTINAFRDAVGPITDSQAFKIASSIIGATQYGPGLNALTKPILNKDIYNGQSDEQIRLNQLLNRENKNTAETAEQGDLLKQEAKSLGISGMGRLDAKSEQFKELTKWMASSKDVDDVNGKIQFAIDNKDPNTMALIVNKLAGISSVAILQGVVSDSEAQRIMGGVMSNFNTVQANGFQPKDVQRMLSSETWKSAMNMANTVQDGLKARMRTYRDIFSMEDQFFTRAGINLTPTGRPEGSLETKNVVTQASIDRANTVANNLQKKLTATNTVQGINEAIRQAAAEINAIMQSPAEGPSLTAAELEAKKAKEKAQEDADYKDALKHKGKAKADKFIKDYEAKYGK